VMPFSIVLEATDGWWPFGADWCDVWHSIDVLASTASILNLSVIALDRYWAITDPIAYPRRMSTARAVFFIALVWICSAAISFPAIAWWRHAASRAPATQPPQPFTCAFTDDSAYLRTRVFVYVWVKTLARLVLKVKVTGQGRGSQRHTSRAIQGQH